MCAIIVSGIRESSIIWWKKKEQNKDHILNNGVHELDIEFSILMDIVVC